MVKPEWFPRESLYLEVIGTNCFHTLNTSQPDANLLRMKDADARIHLL